MSHWGQTHGTCEHVTWLLHVLAFPNFNKMVLFSQFWDTNFGLLVGGSLLWTSFCMFLIVTVGRKACATYIFLKVLVLCHLALLLKASYLIGKWVVGSNGKSEIYFLSIFVQANTAFRETCSKYVCSKASISMPIIH